MDYFYEFEFERILTDDTDFDDRTELRNELRKAWGYPSVFLPSQLKPENAGFADEMLKAWKRMVADIIRYFEYKINEITSTGVAARQRFPHSTTYKRTIQALTGTYSGQQEKTARVSNMLRQHNDPTSEIFKIAFDPSDTFGASINWNTPVPDNYEMIGIAMRKSGAYLLGLSPQGEINAQSFRSCSNRDMVLHWFEHLRIAVGGSHERHRTFVDDVCFDIDSYTPILGNEVKTQNDFGFDIEEASVAVSRTFGTHDLYLSGIERERNFSSSQAKTYRGSTHLMFFIPRTGACMITHEERMLRHVDQFFFQRWIERLEEVIEIYGDTDNTQLPDYGDFNFDADYFIQQIMKAEKEDETKDILDGLSPELANIEYNKDDPMSYANTSRREAGTTAGRLKAINSAAERDQVTLVDLAISMAEYVIALMHSNIQLGGFPCTVPTFTDAFTDPRSISGLVHDFNAIGRFKHVSIFNIAAILVNSGHLRMKNRHRTVDSRWVVTPRMHDFSKRGTQTFEQINADVGWMIENNLWFHPRDFPESFLRSMGSIQEEIRVNAPKLSILRVKNNARISKDPYEIKFGRGDSLDKVHFRVCEIFNIQSLRVASRFIHFADRLSSGAPDKTAELSRIGLFKMLHTGHGYDVPLNTPNERIGDVSDPEFTGDNGLVFNMLLERAVKDSNYPFTSGEFEEVFQSTSDTLQFFSIDAKLVLFADHFDWEIHKKRNLANDEVRRLMQMAVDGIVPLDHRITEPINGIRPEFLLIIQMITLMWLTAVEFESKEEEKRAFDHARRVEQRTKPKDLLITSYNVSSRTFSTRGGWTNDGFDFSNYLRIALLTDNFNELFSTNKLSQNPYMAPYLTIFGFDKLMTEKSGVYLLKNIREICSRVNIDASDELSFERFFMAVFPRPLPEYVFGFGATDGKEKLFGSFFDVDEPDRPLVEPKLYPSLASLSILQRTIADNPLLRQFSFRTIRTRFVGDGKEEEEDVSIELLEEVYRDTGDIGQMLLEGTEWFRPAGGISEVYKKTNILQSDYGIPKIHMIALCGFAMRIQKRYRKLSAPLFTK